MRALLQLLVDKIENMSPGERNEINSALLPSAEPAPPQQETRRRGVRFDTNDRRYEYDQWGSDRSRDVGAGPVQSTPLTESRPAAPRSDQHPANLFVPYSHFRFLHDQNRLRRLMGPNQNNFGIRMPECLNYVFGENGCTTPNCPRRCNHTDIAPNSDRHRACLAFRREALSNRQARQQDFC